MTDCPVSNCSRVRGYADKAKLVTVITGLFVGGILSMLVTLSNRTHTVAVDTQHELQSFQHDHEKQVNDDIRIQTALVTNLNNINDRLNRLATMQDHVVERIATIEENQSRKD